MTFIIDWPQLVGLATGVILPLLVGLVTTKVTDSRVKALLLAGLSFAINLLTELGAALSQGVVFDLFTALVSGFGTFLVAVGMHYGLWKATGASGVVQDALIRSGGES